MGVDGGIDEFVNKLNITNLYKTLGAHPRRCQNGFFADGLFVST